MSLALNVRWRVLLSCSVSAVPSWQSEAPVKFPFVGCRTLNLKTNSMLRRVSRWLADYALTQVYWRLRGLNLDVFTTVRIAGGARITVDRSVRFRRCRLIVGSGAVLEIGAGSLISGTIIVAEGCRLQAVEGFRLIGARISVDNHSTVSFGCRCLVSRPTSLDAYLSVSEGHFTAGDNTSLQGVVRVERGVVEIGACTFINHGTEIRSNHHIKIGDFVYVSYLCDIFDTNSHPVLPEERAREVDMSRPNRTVTDLSLVKTSPVKIHDYVWIGKSAAILKGVTLGAGVVVGMRSVVTRSFPPRVVVAGNPAAVLHTIPDGPA